MQSFAPNVPRSHNIMKAIQLLQLPVNQIYRLFVWRRPRSAYCTRDNINKYVSIGSLIPRLRLNNWILTPSTSDTATRLSYFKRVRPAFITHLDQFTRSKMRNK